MKKYAVIIVLIACAATPLLAFRNVKKFRVIEFKGLAAVSKFEIIEAVPRRLESDGIVLDVDALGKHMSGMPIIETFKLDEDDDRLVVTVTEKKPAYILAVDTGTQLSILELDRDLDTVAVNRVHGKDAPVLVIGAADIRNGVMSGRLRSLIALLRLCEQDFPALYREISEVDYRDGRTMIVTLHARRTRFYMNNAPQNFAAVQRCVGYLDSHRFYPQTVKLIENFLVLR